jgi:2-methylisocitrate lyase-like PEP mutase family enzyme
LSVADIAALGVRRISVGPALALAAWTGFRRAAQLLKSEGSFAGLANLVPSPDINGFFTTDYRARQADSLRSAGHHEYNGSTHLGQQEDRGSNAS